MARRYHFQFKYKLFPFELEDKSPKDKFDILRPCINTVLHGPNAKVNQPFLLDSGADYIFIRYDVANLLGLTLSKDMKTITTAGSAIKVYESNIKIELVQGKSGHILGEEIPCYVFKKGIKLPNIMGREPLFNEFKVTFEQYQNVVRLSYMGHIYRRKRRKGKGVRSYLL